MQRAVGDLVVVLGEPELRLLAARLRIVNDPTVAAVRKDRRLSSRGCGIFCSSSSLPVVVLLADNGILYPDMTQSVRSTAACVDFITRARWKDVPPDAAELAKRCIVDGLGVMLAGSTTDGSAILRDYVRRTDGGEESTVFGAEVFRASAGAAAFLNAASGHAMDWDDTQLSTTADRIFGLLTHPTIPPLAAALAVGERLRVVRRARSSKRSSPASKSNARSPSRFIPVTTRRAFTRPGTIGTFGAAAATAKLLGLDAKATAHMLSIAASLCAGIRVNFGTMTKPLHVGRAAQNGVLAAELAAAGFTGGKDGLDGPWGFFQVFSFGEGMDEDRIVGKLGNPYTIVSPGVSIKPYPCGVLGHPTMDAMRALVTTHDVKPEADQGDPGAGRLEHPESAALQDRADRARSEVLPGVHGVGDRAAPEGRHPRVHRRIRPERAGAADDGALRERFSTRRSKRRGSRRSAARSKWIWPTGGRWCSAADERYRGGPDRPFTRDELHEKFTECAELVLPGAGDDRNAARGGIARRRQATSRRW